MPNEKHVRDSLQAATEVGSAFLLSGVIEISRLRTALSEIGGLAAERLAAEGVQSWGDAGEMGDTLLAIKDVVLDALAKQQPT